VQIIRRRASGETPGVIAWALGVSPATVYKWLRRHRAEGDAGLVDRSSRPHRLQTRLTADQAQQIEALRRQRLTGRAIADRIGRSAATVARCLSRLGLSRLAQLDPRPPVIRYEKDRPGEMIHIDTKKLGRIDGIGHRITGDRTKQSSKRGTGWEYLHLAVDDHSRLAYSEILPDEKKASAIRFLFNALRFFKRHGVTVERVMTDNGSAFKSRRYATALRRLNIKHKRTRPYTPRTNGKVERFVQTSLREWAYAKPYGTSEQRRSLLMPFIDHYNHHRKHAGIGGKTPMSRINNLSRIDS
jgi:transposase InsO family protein